MQKPPEELDGISCPRFKTLQFPVTADPCDPSGSNWFEVKMDWGGEEGLDRPACI